MRMCSYMEQNLMHVHDCQRMSSECDRQHRDTDHTRSYDTKNDTHVHFKATANQVSRSS